MTERSSLVADAIPFDGTAEAYVADNVRDAIIEARNTATGRARYPLAAGYDANANTGRWLEWTKGIPSNTSSIALPRKSLLAELSLSSRGVNTATVTVFRNGGAVQTISLAAEQTKTLSFLNQTFLVNDRVSIQVTAGSITEPILFMWYEILE